MQIHVLVEDTITTEKQQADLYSEASLVHRFSLSLFSLLHLEIVIEETKTEQLIELHTSNCSLLPLFTFLLRINYYKENWKPGNEAIQCS